MNRNGRMMSNSTTPVTNTKLLNTRPRSLVNVMSPNPNVLMTVKAQ
jgi:hypothetical protein